MPRPLPARPCFSGLRRTARAFALAALVPMAGAAAAAPPATLEETGLYADFVTRALAPGVLAFDPQYPLWSDGAAKRRWILLPPGTSVDASDPDVWRFPVGTKLWKEFAFDRPVETRFIERTADGWRFAAYVWSADASRATLAPSTGVRGAAQSSAGVPYDVPGTADCRACHGGHPATVLGFSALQLSSDRDPRAPHALAPPIDAVDLETLVARGLVVGLPRRVASQPPRVRADTPAGRAALGYLHGNCSACHNGKGPLADLGLSLAVGADGVPDALATAVGRAARYRPAGASEQLVLAPGDPAASLLVRRLSSRQPLLQMPPLGTHAVDREAVALVVEWVRTELARQFAPKTPVEFVSAHTAVTAKERKP
jgi:mono/diheme cytochrome c family protein